MQILNVLYSEAKIKPMVVTSATLPKTNPNLCRRDVQIGKCTFEVVSEFTYLELNVSNDNGTVAELHVRMLAVNRSFYSLRKLFTSKNLSRPDGTHIHL